MAKATDIFFFSSQPFPKLSFSGSKVVSSIRFLLSSEFSIFLDPSHLTGTYVKEKKKKYQYLYCLILHVCAETKLNLKWMDNVIPLQRHPLCAGHHSRVLLWPRAPLLTAHWKEEKYFKPYLVRSWGVCLIKTKSKIKEWLPVSSLKCRIQRF